MTWIAIGVLLLSGLGIMIVSWNGVLSYSPSPSLLVVFWLSMSASGIWLFMLAVKKAHRLWIQEERSRQESETRLRESSSASKSRSKDQQVFDFAATARKLVRRIPEDTPLTESGEVLMKNLARELEIMSGIFYVRKKGGFSVAATYALVTPDQPYLFNEGEGLTGQVARSKQIMVLTRMPEDHLKVYSGLGKSEPAYLAIVPFIHKERTIAVLECSGFKYDPHDIEAMFRILTRDLMDKLSPNLKK